MTVDWSKLITHSGFDDEPQTNVNVTTLYSHCEQEASSKAYEQYIDEKRQDPNHSPARYYQLVEQLMPHTSSKEFVKIYEDHVEVCVDRDQIDDDAIDYALSLLLQVDTFTVGKRIEFGYNKVFGYRETK